jgi:hypothetical protein
MVLGSFSVWLFGTLQIRSPIFSRVSVTLFSLIFVLIIGTSWEVYEYIFDLSFNGMISYPLDTIKDYIVDFAGAGLVLWWHAHRRSLAEKIA